MSLRLRLALVAAAVVAVVLAAGSLTVYLLVRSDLRSQVEAKLRTAKLRLGELQDEALDSAKAAARVTDDYVHDNPWQAIGVSAAIGFLVGLVIARR